MTKPSRFPEFAARALARWCLLAVALMLSGCVTTHEGPLPEPAPDDERVQAQLDVAKAYLRSGEFVNARKRLAQALEIAPRSPEAHVLYGLAYENEEEYALAEASYQKALRFEPEDPQGLNNYGRFLYGQKRYDEALVPLRKLAADTEYRNRGQAFENLGLAELAAGSPERAREAFERSLSFGSVQSKAELELAILAYGAQNVTEASERYETYRSVANPTPRSLCLGMNLARLSGDEDRLASARLALENLYPESPEASNCPTQMR